MPRRAHPRAIASAARASLTPAHTPTVSARIAAVVLTMVFVAAPAVAATPIELVGSLPLTIPAPGGLVTDVWGWVDPATSREYAIVGTRPRGIHIVDVTDPTNPVLVKYVDNVPGFDMTTWGHFLYVCDGDAAGGNDSKILDITNPADPHVLGSFPTGHSVTVSDAGMLWVAFPSLRGLDLTISATAPSVWFSGPGGGHDVITHGNLVFDYSGSGGGCRIYQLLPNKVMNTLGTCYDPGIRYYHSGDRSIDGGYLYICDELATSPSPDITVWDIDPPATPQMVNSISDATATAHNLLVAGNVAYVSYYTAGFKAFNISDPVHPSLIGTWDTTVETGECYCGGAYGVYPFAPSGIIYVSDWDNGLFLFRLTTTTAVRFSSVSAEARDGRVRLTWSVWADESIDGFRVYRRAAGDERDLPLTSTPLPPRTRSFEDADVTPGGRYRYVVSALTADGEELSAPASVTIPEGATGVVSVHPNPFNPRTTIEYETSATGPVAVEVFDARGARVRTLVDRTIEAGRHAASWDGLDAAGRPAASGVYFIRLSAGKRVFTRQIVLLK